MTEETANESLETQEQTEAAHKDREGAPVSTDRFNSVYGKWKGAERENSVLKDELEELKGMVANLQQPQQQQQAAPITLEAFDYDEEAFLNAKLEQKLAEQKQSLLTEWQQQEQEKLNRQQQEARVNDYIQRANQYGNQNPEFVSLFEQSIQAGVALRPELGEIIMGLDNGPQLQHELLKNPEMIQKLNEMPSNLATYQLGQFATNLSKPNLTQAPDPIEPIQGGGTATKPAQSMEEYAAQWRGLPSQRR